MKNKHFLKHCSAWMRAFMILALVFLAIGLGTLGSVHGVGKSYRLPHQRSGDGLVPAIVVRLQDKGHGEENHDHRDLYIKEVYVNVGNIYNEYGESATLRVAYGTSTTSKFYTYNELVLSNLYKETAEEDGTITRTQTNMLYNWVKVPFATEEGYRLAVYPYWQFTARDCDIVINEIVFVANEKDNSGKSVLLEAEINTEITNLPEKDDVLVKKAGAVIDSQHRPSLAQSSYFNFGIEEVHVITSYMEMKQGSSYATDNVYHMDNVYNTFGLDLMFIGPAIFGLSPFGVRFMPMLASFGVLVFGFLFIKRLTGSEKAAFVFAVLFALCGLSISLAHLGTPLMIGVFFFVASLYYCHGFFLSGMKKANFASAVPVLLSAVFAAAAVCTHGAFIVPVLGIVGLFIAGIVRQRKALNAEIEVEAQKAIDEEQTLSANTAETTETTEEKPVYSEGRQRVAKLVNEKNYKQSVAIGIFCAFLVLGYLLMSILSILPLYSTYIKVHDDPSSPARSIFYFLWLAFSGGFTGSNSALELASPFRFAYELYHGTGDMFAVTATGTLVGICAILLGLVGAICTFVAIARKKNLSAHNYAAFILLYGFVLALVTAFFAASGLGFLFLAALFLFGYAALCFAEKDGEEGGEASKSVPKAVAICGLALLVIWFLACAVFTFSIPLPAAFMNVFFG